MKDNDTEHRECPPHLTPARWRAIQRMRATFLPTIEDADDRAAVAAYLDAHETQAEPSAEDLAVVERWRAIARQAE